jgi:hypothetical protein
MKKTSVFLPALIFISLLSCNKSDNNTSQPPADADFMALRTGNYWIYQNYALDTNGVGTPTDDWDSAYISKDTLVNGKTYYKMHRKPVPQAPVQLVDFLRDSSGYLVDIHGNILMSEDNFTDTLRIDSTDAFLYIGYLKMFAKDSLITVPAGTFSTRTARLTVVPSDSNDPHPIRYLYDVYAKNTGRIKYHWFFYNSDKHFESRLVRYHIEP